MNDRFFSLQLFVRVARVASFSVAGREMGISQPTASRIIAALDETDHAARGTGELRGILRIALSTSLAVRTVIPRIRKFSDAHPHLKIEFILNDEMQDLVGESVDVALRVGALGNTSAVVRKIAVVHRVLAASPDYLKRAGTPKIPSDLSNHTIIVGPAAGGLGGWAFKKDGKSTSIRVDGRFILNGTEGATAAAVAGLGIASSGLLGMLREIESGKLVRVLSDWELGSADVHVVVPAGRAAKPSARAFVEFITTDLRENPLTVADGLQSSDAKARRP